MEKTRKNLFVASGILFILTALDSFISFAVMFYHGFGASVSFLDFFMVGAFLLAGLVILIKPDGILVGTAFSLLSLACIFSLKSSLFAGVNAVLFAVFAAAAFFGDKKKLSRLAPVLALFPPASVVAGFIFRLATVTVYGMSSEADRLELLMFGEASAFPSQLIWTLALVCAGAAIVNLPYTEKREKAHKLGCAGAVILGVFGFVTYALTELGVLRNLFHMNETAYFAVGGFLFFMTYLGLFTAPLAFMYRGKSHELSENAGGEGYVSLLRLVLLSLITFGIYDFYRVAKITQYLNSSPKGKLYSPGGQTALYVFIPFYHIYWFYRHGEKIDALAKEKGLGYSDTPVLLLIISLFSRLITMVIMQDRINNICKAD